MTDNLRKEPWNKIENSLTIEQAAEKMNAMFGKLKISNGTKVGAGDVMLHAYREERRRLRKEMGMLPIQANVYKNAFESAYLHNRSDVSEGDYCRFAFCGTELSGHVEKDGDLMLLKVSPTIWAELKYDKFWKAVCLMGGDV